MTPDAEDLPLRWRRTLFEAFADAETRGLGRATVGFTAAPGREDQAADLIGARASFLADQWTDAPDPAGTSPGQIGGQHGEDNPRRGE